MALPTPSPYILVQSDWNEVLKKDEDGEVWISCKTIGSPTMYGTLESTWQKKNPPRLEVSAGFKVISSIQHPASFPSLELSHSDPNCRCRFVAPASTFQSIHNKSVVSLDVTDGGLGVSACFDHKSCKMNIWDTQNGIIRRPLDGHLGDVYTCRFFPSGVVVLSGGADRTLKIWSAETGFCVATMAGHISTINDTAFVDRGRNVVSVSMDHTARLWDCSTSSCITSLTRTHSEINACDIADVNVAPETIESNRSTIHRENDADVGNEFGTEGKLLLIACEDGTLRGLDIRSRVEVFSIPCTSPVTACCFLSSTEVACGCRSGVIMKVDIRQPGSHRFLNSWLDSAAAVLTLRPHPREGGVIAGKADGLCILYDGPDVSVQYTGSDCDPIYGIATNKTNIFTCSRDGAIRKYSA